MKTVFPPKKTPQLKQNARGQAYVWLDGRARFLGRFDDPQAHARYHQKIAEWLAAGRQIIDPKQAAVLTIKQLCEAFMAWAADYYRDPDGRPTSEVNTFERSNKEMVALYGDSPAAEFGPNALRAVRERFIGRDYSRVEVNRCVGHIRKVFKWGVDRQIIPPAIYAGLQCVDALKRGRTQGLREMEPVEPVAIAHVEAIKPHVSRQVWALVQLQLKTGARGGELLRLRPRDLDMSGEVWTYKPVHHKTSWRGKTRTIRFGPAAQEVIRPFLSRAIDRPMFSPAEAEAERLEELHKKRIKNGTPLSCGNGVGRSRKKNPQRQPGDAYTNNSYRRAIQRGCEAANRLAVKLGHAVKVPLWHPHQLRHNAADEIEKLYGLDAAQAVLGHSTVKTTARYADMRDRKAVEVLRAIG